MSRTMVAAVVLVAVVLVVLAVVAVVLVVLVVVVVHTYKHKTHIHTITHHKVIQQFVLPDIGITFVLNLCNDVIEHLNT